MWREQHEDFPQVEAQDAGWEGHLRDSCRGQGLAASSAFWREDPPSDRDAVDEEWETLDGSSV